ncbi:MAG TPA: hypothetical protein VF261_00360, partial [Candidatus Saccharimonadales bacterium]
MRASFDTGVARDLMVRERVDVPVGDRVTDLGDSIALHTATYELGEGKFTNVYDLSADVTEICPGIKSHKQLTSVYDYALANQRIKAVCNGGFFFLADQTSAVPRQLDLNLSLANGVLRNLPVVDREAVLIRNNRLSAEYIKAFGIMSLDGAEISWSGSLTEHDSDVKVYGNGNSIITHVYSEDTGSKRALDEASRFTPSIYEDDTVDVGFIRRRDGVFVGRESSRIGGVDIFAHDVVLRMPERFMHRKLPKMRVHSIGDRTLSGLQGAMSVGPMLGEADFENHQINRDKSLGGKPPFINVPIARVALYGSDNNRVHICLLDGRPGSPTFTGVTPDQAANIINSKDDVVWGCFLDG